MSSFILLLLLLIAKYDTTSSFQGHKNGGLLPDVDHRNVRDVGGGANSVSTEQPSYEYNYTIIIDPKNDTAMDSEDCYPPEEGGISDIPCRTLDFALQFQPQISIKFFLASANSKYPLNTSITFNHGENVAIAGNNQSYPQIPKIECHQSNESGLAFENSMNIVLKSVQFSYCGALRNSTSKNFSAESNDSSTGITLSHFKVALYFNNCTNVDMSNVHVNESFQAIGVVMYNTVGKVSINMSNFINNKVVVNGKENLFGGGGFAVEFTYCQPGDNSCNDASYNSAGHRNRNAQYFFTGCLFHNNRAIGQSLRVVSSSMNFIIPLNTSHESFGRGGGLSVYFKGDATNNTIVIENCHFIHNRAVWGGGLLIEMDDNTINNMVVVSRCFFKHNHCNFTEEYGTGGGALRIATTVYFWDYSYKNRNTTSSVVRIEGCTFIHNKALEGGALSVALARQGRSHHSQVTKILISHSTFRSNLGRIGSAAQVSLHPLFPEGYLSKVTFTDCTFSDNNLNYSRKTMIVHVLGMGAVYVNGISVDFNDTAKFINNSGSALAVVGAQINFSGCNAIFSKNRGGNGGGIALLGVAFLLIGPNTRMNFTDNHVSGYGGAIYNHYIGQENMKSNINCFMRYEDPFVAPRDWEVWFYFRNNSADKLGNSIYSSSILPCSLAGHNFGKRDEIFCWNNESWVYDSSKCHCQIYTSARNFTLTNTAKRSDHRDNTIYPGRDIDLQLQATDDLGHDVTKITVYSASIPRKYQDFAQVDPRFAYIADNSIIFNGQPDKNFSVRIETAAFPKVHINKNVTMKKCPPGFILKPPLKDRESEKCKNMNTLEDNGTSASAVCQCIGKHSYRGNLRCYAKDWSSQISTKFWIGFDSNQLDMEDSDYSKFLMGSFPPIYSLHRKRSKNSITLSGHNHHRDLDQSICGGEHRTGVLCGKCMENYAVAINSPNFECVLCNHTMAGKFMGHFIGYVSLTYFPILILLFVIFYFNIKLTSSAASGFILYAQMISSGIFNITGGTVSYLDVGSFPHVMQRMYRTAYGIFNLDSLANALPSFCLNKRFTTLDVICLDYVTASFPLIIILLTHFVIRYNLLRCCKCVKIKPARKLRGRIAQKANNMDTKLLHDANNVDNNDPKAPRKSLIHAFIAFILLSYTKFSLAAMNSLHTTHLFDAEGTTVASDRIYLAGHLSLNSHRYLLPYGLLAIFVFITIILLPPLLLLGPLQFMDWLLEKPGFNRLHKIWPSIAVHTFLDTFQGFYKPNRRFFAGMYFLFRLVVFLSFCFASSAILRYTIQQVATLVMIVLISVLQPYKNNFFNHVDTLIFFNLSILNAFALYNVSSNTTEFSMALYVFECFLVWSPLVYMVSYTVWSCVHNSKYNPKISIMCLRMANQMRGRENQPLLRDSMTTLQQLRSRAEYHDLTLTDSFTDADKGMFKRAAGKNTYRPAKQKKGDGVKTTVVSLTSCAATEEHTELQIRAESESSCNESEHSGAGLQSNTSNISTSL
jgi:hypothetical protein